MSPLKNKKMRNHPIIESIMLEFKKLDDKIELFVQHWIKAVEKQQIQVRSYKDSEYNSKNLN